MTNRERSDPQQEHVWVQKRQVGILWICVLQRQHLTSPQESCRCRQSSDNLNSIRVRSLLGMTNYCSRFILDYTTKTGPLRKLTHKDLPWCWAEGHDHTVSQLKRSTCKCTRRCLLWSTGGCRDLLMQVQSAWQPSSHRSTWKLRKVTLTPTQVALLQQPNSSTAERKVLTRLGLWTFTPVFLLETGQYLHRSQGLSTVSFDVRRPCNSKWPNS